MHDALEAAQAACDRKPKDAEAWWLLGCVSRYAGLRAASDEAFRRAATLSRNHQVPYRLSRERFQQLVSERTKDLSPDARRRLTPLRIKVEDLPAVDDVKRGTSPDALTKRDRDDGNSMVLYQVNHENRSGSESGLANLIGRSLSRA
jgi:hypothetical protein